MNLTDRTFSRLVLIALAIGFAALTAAGAMAIFTVSQNQAHERLVEHTYKVGNSISQYQLLLERAEAARRGFLIDRSRRFEAIYDSAIGAVATQLDSLAGLTRDNPRSQANVERLRALTRAQTVALDNSIELARAGNVERALALFNQDESARTLSAIRALSEQMVASELTLLAQRNIDQEASLSRLYLTFAGAALLLLLVGLGSGSAIRRYTSDLAASRDNLRNANANLESAVEVRTADLQRANDEIQRFAYIISHDLRAPLVNVMGFTAELETASRHLIALVERVDAEAPAVASDEARLAVREDLPESIGFIRSSTQKMERLINAILKLAREGRRSLTPQRLAMTPLITSITDSLEHRLQEKGATIIVEKPLPDIVSDRVAIEQLFSNLIENAVKYLKDGRPGRIMVRGSQQGNRLIYEIEDNGRGIDPRDHQRIFDLFRRSGQQDQTGEGIGLAHVRTLAYRLGGTIDVHSALGEGATFRLNLPVTYRDEGTAA